MTGVTYDSGALIAADRDDRRMWILHRRLLQRGQTPAVPAGVLAQAWRGGPQPLLSRLLAGCQIEALTESLARSAGTLLAGARSADVIDATVVVGASARRDSVFTSDRGDLEALSAGIPRRIGIVDV
jgi:hypothetical protein